FYQQSVRPSAPRCLDLSGLITRAWLPKGLARTLSQNGSWPTPLRALRRPSVTLARHRIGQPADAIASPAFPVPGGVACVTGRFRPAFSRQQGTSPKKVKTLD